jgi:hypothetical protein
MPSIKEASEFAVPKSASLPGDLVGRRYWWPFLRDADRRQVDSVQNGILSADNTLTTGTILGICNPAPNCI